MKKSLFFTLVLTCVCVICSGQEILSNEAAFRAEYRFLYKMDSLKQGYFSDVFHLDICRSGHSYFYSRATQYRDSVKYASLSQGLDAYQASNAIRGLPKGLPWYVDKRFVEGVCKCLSEGHANKKRAQKPCSISNRHGCSFTVSFGTLLRRYCCFFRNCGLCGAGGYGLACFRCLRAAAEQNCHYQYCKYFFHYRTPHKYLRGQGTVIVVLAGITLSVSLRSPALS